MPSDILAITLEHGSGIRYHPTVANERDAAVQDLVHSSVFRLASGLPPPYRLTLAIQENRILFDACAVDSGMMEAIRLPVVGLRGVIRDYFLMCDSYYQAMTALSPGRLEAIDMGRRGAHNAGAEQLALILQDSVTLDNDTARRLFTLVSVLHIRNQQRVLIG